MKYYAVRENGLYLDPESDTLFSEPRLLPSKTQATQLVNERGGTVVLFELKEIKVKNLAEVIEDGYCRNKKSAYRHIYHQRNQIAAYPVFKDNEVSIEFQTIENSKIWSELANNLPEVAEWCQENGLYQIALAECLEKLEQTRVLAIKELGG